MTCVCVQQFLSIFSLKFLEKLLSLTMGVGGGDYIPHSTPQQI